MSLSEIETLNRFHRWIGSLWGWKQEELAGGVREESTGRESRIGGMFSGQGRSRHGGKPLKSMREILVKTPSNGGHRA